MPISNTAPFLLRLYQYQKERFPIAGHGLLIGVFSFSAIAYSRLCRGLPDFVSPERYWVCLFNTFTLFFLLRVADEHKDREDDARFRAYLPVPRGLVSLRELRAVAYVLMAAQLLANVFLYPEILPLYAAVMLFLGLMAKEFFVRDWLKQRLFWYVASHMLIIPLVDVFASGFDWLLNGAAAPVGLVFFFFTSYCNGLVLEIGRKIKPPDHEEPGVQSYTHVLGHAEGCWPLAAGAVHYCGVGIAIRQLCRPWPLGISHLVFFAYLVQRSCAALPAKIFAATRQMD